MDSRSDRNGAFDPKALTESHLKALLRALANLPDAELLFLDRRIQAAKRRRAAQRDVN